MRTRPLTIVGLLVASILTASSPDTLTLASSPAAVFQASFPAVRLAAGAAHSLGVLADGSVWSWGSNALGQLGDGTTSSRTMPTSVTGLQGVFVAVAAGTSHSLALREDGTVFAWGLNADGQLGDGTTTLRRQAVPVSGLTGVVAIAAGASHSLALKANGTIVAWGANLSGQLGDNSFTRRLTPVAVSGISTGVAIAAGGFHSLAVMSNGSVRAWGLNLTGQLGDGTILNRKTPVAVVGLTGVASVAGGATHSLALTSGGAVKAWGGNVSGQLGDGTILPRLTPITVSGIGNAVSIAAGGLHSLAALASGSGRAWGGNLTGQLGDGTIALLRLTPVAVVSPPSQILAVAAGGSHSLSQGSDHSAWSWGLNLFGQLGDGSTATSLVPVPIGDLDEAWGVIAPAFSPGEGAYSSPLSVTISTVTSGATIRYTTNGADPTTSSPSIANGGSVQITTTTVLKAKAFKAGLTASRVTSALYTIVLGTLATPVANPPGGTYAAPQSVTLTADAGATIHFTLDGTEPTSSSPVYATPIAVATTATIKARAFQVNYTPSAILTASYVIQATNELPPDPATVATPIDPTVATNFTAATAFLYSGANPIQRDVTPGAIEGYRAAVLRGRVLNRDGTVLAGAKITILNHGEFGYTLSRANGMFDLAVNGGGPVTLDYSHAGHLSVQRTLDVPWQDYVVAPDVRLTPLDSQVTVVGFAASGSAQVARGSSVSDADGARQATIIVPETGSYANLVFPDGTVLPAQAQLSIRATEYTVGPGGPQAMPADLPKTSGYTYAVELSADEVTQAGATHVTFDPPLPFYVENFLGMPVGIKVPVGSYDRRLAAWVPTNDGRVISIVSIISGRAELDIDGDGNPDDASALGVTDGERQKLAELYQTGQSLWRVPIPHFSPHDMNWPLGPPTGPITTNLQRAKPQRPEDNPCERQHSIIECQNQTLGERLLITGTPFTLNYRSDRVKGRTSATSLTIPLSNALISPTLSDIELEVTVAGRKFTQAFTGGANLTAQFAWDGLDAYGRRPQGAQPTTITVRHSHIGRYGTRADFERTFGLVPRESTGITGRERYLADQTYAVPMGTITDATGVVGGWSLNVHHRYDPGSRTLYLGDGTRRTADTIGAVTKTAAGGGSGSIAVGVPVRNVRLRSIGGLAATAEGGFVFTHFEPSGGDMDAEGEQPANPAKMIRVNRAGVISAITPMATLTFDPGLVGSADGSAFYTTPADDACRLASTFDRLEIRRVGAAGDETVVNTIDMPGQVTCAVTPRLSRDADGTMYVSTGKVESPGGLIFRVAPGDGGVVLLRDWPDDILSVASGPDGSVYFSTPTTIERLGTDGIVLRVAGTGVDGFGGDGVATEIPLAQPGSITVTSDGSLSFLEGGFDPAELSVKPRVRRISPAGMITTIGGGGSSGEPSVDGRQAIGSSFDLTSTNGLAVSPDGDPYVVERRRIIKLTPAFSSADAGVKIVSSDGGEIYEFSSEGRHLRTRDSLLGVVTYSFGYDTEGRLVTITDRDGLITTIQRGAAGAPTGILGPFGQRTALTIDANGYLASVADPGGHTTRLTTSPDGLLTSVIDANNHESTFQYDALGRLTHDEDAAGGSETLTRTDDSQGWTSTSTTALGRVYTYRTDLFGNGDRRMVTTAADGSQAVQTTRLSGTTESLAPDGTRTSVRFGPDPRFGMQVPFANETTVRTPSGLLFETTSTREVSLADPQDPLSVQTLTDTMVVNGRVSQTVFDASSQTVTATTPMGRVTTTTVDAQGRVTRQQTGTLTPVEFTYDPQGRLQAVTQGTRTLAYAYTTRGELASVTDPLSRRVDFAYDAAGRVTTQTRPDAQTITFDYDPVGNVTAITPPEKPAHGFAFTQVHLLERYDPPVVGSATPTQYTYTTDREPDTVTRPDGQTVSAVFDAGGRVQSVTAPGVSRSYAYNSAGQLTTVTAPEATLTFAYDGALPIEERWAGGVAGRVSRTFDASFRLIEERVNAAHSVTFTYDDDGLLTSAGDLGLSSDPANGLLTNAVVGPVETAFGYDAFGAVNSTATTIAGTSALSMTYTRDALGRIQEQTETVLGLTHTDVYGYDAAGRLTAVTRDGTPLVTYAYDANGNRLSETTAGGTVTSTYDAQDRLLTLGATTFTYTATGELRTRTNTSGTTTYTYDVLGNLTSVTLPTGAQVAYAVDGSNRRITRVVDGVRTHGWLYQGALRPIAEVDAGGAVVTRFVYGTHVNVPDYFVRGGVTYRVVTDHLGSVRVVIDTSTNAVVQQLAYDPFGRVTIDTNPGFQPFGFAGGLYDPVTGLARFGARDYDAATGRWTAKDPIGFSSTDTNIYAYNRSDAVNAIDPSGLLTIPGIGWVDVGELWGNEALRYWASKIDDANASVAERTLGWVGGFFAALWTPCSSDATFATLTAAYGAGVGIGAKTSTIGEGTKVFRVWGDEAGAWGRSWTTVDPRTVPGYRNAAGLPNQNTGRFLSEGILQNTEGVTARGALPLHGNAGGLPEVVIPNPAQQIKLQNVQGLNPRF